MATMPAEADALTTVGDDIAARFPPLAGSLPRTSAPAPATDLDEEHLLLASATAHPGDVEQMRWLTAGDFTQPLCAGLWQCFSETPLAHLTGTRQTPPTGTRRRAGLGKSPLPIPAPNSVPAERPTR
ncbi:hypothetical protein [Streptomyces sp. NPDC052179]|uniref:hypothetical protein n=1 Tax=Streptomyces sp. NPDC052179 TaxID=3155680 RepID=UPI0034283D8A